MSPTVPEGAAAFAGRAGRYALYFEAISGRWPSFHLFSSSERRIIPADTDETVRLPEEVSIWADQDLNWGWYRVALAHKGLRWDSDRGTFALPGEMDPAVAELLSRQEAEYPEAPQHAGERLRRCLAAFPHAGVARSIFDIAEGLRLDTVMKSLLPGLEPMLARVREAESEVLETAEASGNARELFLRSVLDLTFWDDARTRWVPAPVVERLATAGEILAPLRRPGATVDLSIRATIGLYALTYRMAPALSSDALVETHIGVPAVPGNEAAPSKVSTEGWERRRALEGEDRFTFEVPRATYRSSIGTLDLDHRGTGRVRPSSLLAWREGGPADHDHDEHHHHARPRHDEAGKGPDEDYRLPEPRPHEHEGGSKWEIGYTARQLGGGAQAATYPEWNYRRQEYLPAYCRVIDDVIKPRPGGQEFARRVLSEHRNAVRQLQRKWQQLPAEGLGVVHRLAEGDDIELTPLVESFIDFHSCGIVEDDIYRRTIPSTRDVATLLLLDASMSTARTARPDADQRDRAAAHRIYGKQTRSVLDLERESAALLGTVAERMGDRIAIAATSSLGRSTVRNYWIKRESERMSPLASRRLHALRPLDGTRLGAAIRHGARQILRSEARTKHLIVLSDGLPYDFDYGDDEPDQLEYAMHDVRRALHEAELAGVRTAMVVLGVEPGDLAPHPTDWLSVSDIGELPEILATNYLQIRRAS